jgi:hypothetical protein
MIQYSFAYNFRAIILTNFFNKSRVDDPDSCFLAIIREVKAITSQSIKNRLIQKDTCDFDIKNMKTVIKTIFQLPMKPN